MVLLPVLPRPSCAPQGQPAPCWQGRAAAEQGWAQRLSAAARAKDHRRPAGVHTAVCLSCPQPDEGRIRQAPLGLSGMHRAGARA